MIIANYNAAGELITTGGGGAFAPLDATYITQTPNSILSNEQALSALSTGIAKITTGTGVISIASGPDLPSHTHAAADITSGQLVLERGGTEADLGATGPGFLKQASAGAAVTVATLVAGDIPNLDASKITTGILALARGGTGSTLQATGPGFLKQTSPGAVVTVAVLVDDDIPNSLTISSIKGANGFAVASFADVASAVNAWDIRSAATGGSPSITATGSDTDVTGRIRPKGAGNIVIVTGIGWEMLNVGDGGLVVNEQNQDIDSRIEGLNDPNLIYVDAGANRVSVGNAAPTARFMVDGRGDEVQLQVDGHTSQAQDLVQFRNSAGDVLVGVRGVGALWGMVGLYSVKDVAGQQANVAIRAPAGSVRALVYETGTLASATTRWQVIGSADAESGSDAGSNYRIDRHNDAGTFQESVVFIQRSNGRMGIGTADSAYLLGKLNIAASYGSGDNANQILTATAAGDATRIMGRRVNGTLSAPTQVVSGNAVLAVGTRGWHSGGAFHADSGGNLVFVATENYTATAQGTRIALSTTPNGAIAPLGRLLIGQDGRVTIGNNVSPTAKLMIDGEADEPQFVVQGHSSQASSLIIVEDSAGNDFFTLSGDGAAAFTRAAGDVVGTYMASAVTDPSAPQGINFYNTDTTANNLGLMAYRDNAGGAFVKHGARYVDHTNKYGEFTMITRDTDGLLERAKAYKPGLWALNDPFVMEGRLTLTSGTPVTTSDVTGATVVYLALYKGRRISLYNGTIWETLTLSEISIKLTDTQNGTTTNGSAVVTGLTDTSQLIPGMNVTGTGIAGSSVINSVDSATQITMNNNATASGTVALTFTVPVNTNLDIWCFNNSGTPKLEMTKWTNDTTRATALAFQDGIYVKSGATTRRYIGTVRTTDTAGQCIDKMQFRQVWNYYNRVKRTLEVKESTQSWTYATNTWRPGNNTGANRVGFVLGVAEDAVEAQVTTLIATSATSYGAIAIGLDSTTTPSGAYAESGVQAMNGIGNGFYTGMPSAGYHYLQWLEVARSGSTVTFFGLLANAVQGGVIGAVWA